MGVEPRSRLAELQRLEVHHHIRSQEGFLFVVNAGFIANACAFLFLAGEQRFKPLASTIFGLGGHLTDRIPLNRNG